MRELLSPMQPNKIKSNMHRKYCTVYVVCFERATPHNRHKPKFDFSKQPSTPDILRLRGSNVSDIGRFLVTRCARSFSSLDGWCWKQQSPVVWIIHIPLGSMLTPFHTISLIFSEAIKAQCPSLRKIPLTLEQETVVGPHTKTNHWSLFVWPWASPWSSCRRCWARPENALLLFWLQWSLVRCEQVHWDLIPGPCLSYFHAIWKGLVHGAPPVQLK